MAFLAALIAALPGVFWLVLFYRSDRFDPEPKKLVARTFLVGAIGAAAFALV
jgi:RsiW-degrading membrane proteinase PrsW (M82 family)